MRKLEKFYLILILSAAFLAYIFFIKLGFNLLNDLAYKFAWLFIISLAFSNLLSLTIVHLLGGKEKNKESKTKTTNFPLFRAEQFLSLKTVLYLSLYGFTIAIILAAIFLEPNFRFTSTIFNLIVLFLAMPFFTKNILSVIVSPWYKVYLAYQERSFKKSFVSRKEYQPLVSVLIPAYNEEVGIVATLKSLAMSNYSRLEVIVINDGSQDRTEEKIKEFITTRAGQLGPEFKYFFKHNGGKALALNFGLEKAKGEIIMTIDADSLADKQYISRMVQYFRNAEVMSVAGNVKIGNNRSLLGRIQSLEYLFGFYFKQADALMNAVYIVGGAAAAYRRTVLDLLGNFNTENITEDIEMSMRIQAAGFKIVYAPDAIIYTEGPSSLADLVKQRIRWKYGRFETFRQYSYMFFSLNKKHSKSLSFYILPMALFAEFMLLFDLYLMTFLYVISFYNLMFASLIAFAAIFSAAVLVQMIEYKSTERLKKPFAFVGIAWLLFYAIVIIEYLALVQCLLKSIRKQPIKWQTWQRTGVYSAEEKECRV
jgi:cellulose synthase/poly-beta-1,6-N-acetylglucosamine synthase-like glycosyltransferase